ncbi:MAG: hypothetical protein K2N61_09670 [Lachnospiraceae bacterium]|nr:hypothetical protein [Lachnospiraceae bacterium]
MDWKVSVDKFLKKGNSTAFYEFFYNTLGFHQKDKAGQWRALGEHLKKWNKKHSLQSEQIVLYSPELWYTLNIDVSSFCISENETCIEDCLYWAFLSDHMNSCITDSLILRMEENKKNSIDFFIKNEEDIGLDVKHFIRTCPVNIFKNDYIWIDTETFLQELAQKRESSYQKMMKDFLESTKIHESDLQKYFLPAYEKYKKYETVFQNAKQNKTVLEITEINPHGMKNLVNDTMWYLVKMENQVYIFTLRDYDDSWDDDDDSWDDDDCV